MGAATEYAIETTGLTRHYGSFVAVENLSLCVPRGSFYGFLGPNGAGKSTTIKMLTGLLSPTSGAAQLLGMDIHDDALEIKRRVGVVPEDLGLFDNLTGGEYLTFVGRMHGLCRADILQRTEELLLLLGLDDSRRALTCEYSHGMKKKLCLAAAIIHDPELLFLDEPFEGIDALASRTIRQVLARMTERGSTIFLTSHILEVVERLCTEVGIIAKGCLVASGSMAEMSLGGRLEDAFVKAVGHVQTDTPRLSWLRH